MKWTDALTLALRSLGRRRGRASLTIVAVALASGLLVALASIAQTADSRIIGELGKGGPATAITVQAAEADPFSAGADTAKAGKAKDIDDAVVARIRSLPSVNAVIPVLSARVLVIPLAPLPEGAPPLTTSAGGVPVLPEPFVENVVGVDLTRINSLPVTLLAGRLPALNATAEIDVTTGYLDRLHIPATNLTSVIGTEVELAEPQVQNRNDIRIRGRRVRMAIVGVVAQQAATGQLLGPIAETQRARAWALGGVDDPNLPLPTSQYTGLLVIAASLDSVHEVRQDITALGYATSAPEHLVATVQKYLHVVDIVLGAIGLVALVIAALGIADALLAAVRERRQEIATLKAIGARDRDVVRWFLVEAAIVGALGGVVGTVVGLLVAFGVGVTVNRYLVQQGLIGIDFGTVPLTIAVGGVVGSLLLAVVAGGLPALRAARLPAYEALGGGV